MKNCYLRLLSLIIRREKSRAAHPRDDKELSLTNKIVSRSACVLIVDDGWMNRRCLDRIGYWSFAMTARVSLILGLSPWNSTSIGFELGDRQTGRQQGRHTDRQKTDSQTDRRTAKRCVEFVELSASLPVLPVRFCFAFDMLLRGYLVLDLTRVNPELGRNLLGRCRSYQSPKPRDWFHLFVFPLFYILFDLCQFVHLQIKSRGRRHSCAYSSCSRKFGLLKYSGTGSSNLEITL